MLDVIHYFFEEDVIFTSGEQAESQSDVRIRLYRDLYKTSYKYPHKTKGSRSNGQNYIDPAVIDEPFVQEDLPKPFEPKASKPKPFVPATKLNIDAADPFGGVLDAPIR